MPSPDLFAKHRGQTLGQILNGMVARPVPVIPPAEPERPARGGSEMPGSLTLPEPHKPLPFWWPGRR